MFLFVLFFRPHELFNWLLALDDRDYETWDKGRISWHVRYQRAAARTHRPSETSKSETSKSETVAKPTLTSTLSMMADQPSSNVDIDKHSDDEEMVRIGFFSFRYYCFSIMWTRMHVRLRGFVCKHILIYNPSSKCRYILQKLHFQTDFIFIT